MNLLFILITNFWDQLHRLSLEQATSRRRPLHGLGNANFDVHVVVGARFAPTQRLQWGRLCRWRSASPALQAAPTLGTFAAQCFVLNLVDFIFPSGNAKLTFFPVGDSLFTGIFNLIRLITFWLNFFSFSVSLIKLGMGNFGAVGVT
jgi:hypothetical protein